MLHVTDLEKQPNDVNNIDINRLVVYVSEQSHFCIEQASRICGINVDNIRYIESNDDDCRIKHELIEPIIEKDIKNNLVPFLICGNAGTTNSGAIDDLDELYNIAQKYNLWYHIDGAYGGLFTMTDIGKKELKGISNADSIVIDPHKTLFIPYGVGALIVKNKSHLLNANTFTGACMPTEINNSSTNTINNINNNNIDDISNSGIELTRNFRGLTVWLPFKYYGIDTFTNELNNKLNLTQYCYNRLINEIPFIKCKHKRLLTVFAFQIDRKLLCKYYKDSNIFLKSVENGIFNDIMLDEMNQMFLDNVNKRNRVFLSAFRNINEYSKNGQFCLRIAILSFRTQLKHVTYAIDDIKAACTETISFFADKLERSNKGHYD